MTSPDTLDDNTSKVVQFARALLQTSRQTYIKAWMSLGLSSIVTIN